MTAHGRFRANTMCELLGVTSRDIYDANPLLKRFYEHCNANRDGWGLAVFRGKGVSLEKEAMKASESLYLKQRLSRSVESRNIFAHLRRATVGRVEYANCHPFVWDDISGRTWTLMHNGTLFQSGGTYRYHSRQEGTTDSERLLIYIVGRINDLIRTCGEGYTDDPEVRFRLIECVMSELSRGNKMNVLLYDSEYMYVHCNCYGTLNECMKDNAKIFATKPVNIGTADWKPVKMCTLMIYKDGELVWEGKAHKNEFDESRNDLSSLYAAYAEL